MHEENTIGVHAIQQEIADSLLQFIKDNFPAARRREVLPADRLLEEGIVDSLGLLTIIEHVELTYGIMVGEDELQNDYFGTVASLSEFILSKQ